MISTSGRYVIIFNGEIYNHHVLRDELSKKSLAPFWNGHSDTEVALAYIEAFGLDRALACFVGMFAIALLDRQEHKLILVRDRVGEKPLYWSSRGGHLFFGSELNALRAHPRFSSSISFDSVAQLIDFNYIPSPYSIYDEVAKIRPGHLISIDINSGSTEEKSYWAPLPDAQSFTRFDLSPECAVDELHQLIRQAVGMQLQADVPVGTFLSGGIDSSTIVAVAQSLSKSKINTFSIGFEEAGFDEAVAARAIAGQLGTNHTDLYVSSKDARDVIPHLVDIYDEPFADSSQIPTYLVAQLARKSVTVSLSGDGGDELFLGYNRYLVPEYLWKILFSLPKLSIPQFRGRKAISDSMFGDKPDGNLGLISKAIKNYTRIAGLLRDDPASRYRNLIAHNPPGWLLVNRQVKNRLTSHAPFPFQVGASNRLSINENMALVDILNYLPDDILTKVDRAAMAVSLETRIPFLDHRIIEFAFTLPPYLKVRGNERKWILRQVLYKYIDPSLFGNKKMGFSIPLKNWLQGPLSDWADDLLAVDRLRRQEIFRPEIISEMWSKQKSGAANYSSTLWSILMFQTWHDKYHSI